MKPKYTTLSLLTASMTVSLFSPLTVHADTQVVAQTGATSPDGNGDFDEINSDVALNAQGQVAFIASLVNTADGANDDEGVFRGDGTAAGLIQIARESAPTFSTFGLTDFRNAYINDAGQIGFDATRTSLGIGDSDRAIVFLGSGGPLTKLFEEGDPIPASSGGGTIGYVSLKGINANGTGLIYSGEPSRGLYVNSGSGVTSVARIGDPAPNSGSFSFLTPEFASLNDAGQVTFLANRSGTPSDEAIFRWNNHNSYTVIAERYGAGPGLASGEFYDGFLSLGRLNNSGQVVFEAFIGGTPGGLSDDLRLLVSDGTHVTEIIREGQAPPDGIGQIIRGISYKINDTGHVGFQAIITGTSEGGTTESALFISNGSALTQVLREGQDIPDRSGSYDYIRGPYALNNRDVIAFVTGDTVLVNSLEIHTDTGLHLGNGIDILTVAAEGDALGGSTIAEIRFDAAGLNDENQVAYQALLDNGLTLVALYSVPDAHWNSTSSSEWAGGANWSINAVPNSFHDVFIDPAATVNINGPTANEYVQSLTIDGDGGLATLNLTDDGDMTALEHVTIGTHGRINVGGGRVINTPFLGNSGVLAAAGTGTATVSGYFENTPTGEVRVGAGQQLLFVGTGDEGNAGNINVVGNALSHAEIEFTEQVFNYSSTGQISARNATLRFGGGLGNGGALVYSFGTSDTFGDIDNFGSVVVSGGALVTFWDDVQQDGTFIVSQAGSTSSVAVIYGEFSGSGGASGGGDIFFEGDVAPGNSPGDVHFANDVYFGHFSSIEMELGGTVIGDEYDRISVTGDVYLDGTLDVQLIDEFDPEAGDSFDIFNFASQSGTFGNILLPMLDAGLGWHLGQLYTDGELHVELEGDLNLDGYVGVEDLDLLLANWGDSVLAFDYAAGDASGDGLVGDADLQLVLANFGNGTPGGGNVPEPGSLALLGLGGLAVLKRRR